MAKISKFPPRSKILTVLVCCILAACAADRTRAGLTSSEVVVVVNGASLDSRSLANHFISVRKIPAVNVIVLRDIPNAQVVGVEMFRTAILRPLLAEIARRKLDGHIQCITYSADFPSAIDISADLAALEDLPKIYTARGSINSLTYLYATVNQSDPHYIDLNANFYARRKTETLFGNPGGGATSDAWSKIQQLASEKRHPEASVALEAILTDHPHQFPVAYMAAAEAALAGDAKRAVALLETAISRGWNAGGYLAKDKNFDSLRENPDFQVLELLTDDELAEFQPAIGFDARTFWSPNGVQVKATQGSRRPIKEQIAQHARFGKRYLLSTVLGVTRGAGTSLAEAIAAIRRSAGADSTHPDGGFYFCVTADVRTSTRKWGFLSAVETLKSMGFEAEIIPSILPQNKKNVCGAQIGTPSFDWTTSGSHFVPGALVDNLTSLGGVMTAGSGQTKLTEFLKAGAAGSSGTVTEPYALQQKFPLPQMYVHYARGATLAEAFYMSVSGPYQLLIVGDPLCKPFSNAPVQQVASGLRYLNNNESLEMPIDLSGPRYSDWLDNDIPKADRREALVPKTASILFDGIRLQSRPASAKIGIRLSGQSDGYHEITLKLVADDPLSQSNEVMVPVWLGERDTISLSLPEGADQAGTAPTLIPGPFSLSEEKLNVRVSSNGAKRMTLWHDWEQIAMTEGGHGEFEIPLNTIGLGPARLQARAELPDGSTIHSIPRWIEVVR